MWDKLRNTKAFVSSAGVVIGLSLLGGSIVIINKYAHSSGSVSAQPSGKIAVSLNKSVIKNTPAQTQTFIQSLFNKPNEKVTVASVASNVSDSFRLQLSPSIPLAKKVALIQKISANPLVKSVTVDPKNPSVLIVVFKSQATPAGVESVLQPAFGSELWQQVTQVTADLPPPGSSGTTTTTDTTSTNPTDNPAVGTTTLPSLTTTSSTAIPSGSNPNNSTPNNATIPSPAPTDSPLIIDPSIVVTVQTDPNNQQNVANSIQNSNQQFIQSVKLIVIYPGAPIY